MKEKLKYLIENFDNCNRVFPRGTFIHLKEDRVIYIRSVSIGMELTPVKHFWEKPRWDTPNLHIHSLGKYESYVWDELSQTGKEELYELMTSSDIKEKLLKEREEDEKVNAAVLEDIEEIERKHGIVFTEYDWITKIEDDVRRKRL